MPSKFLKADSNQGYVDLDDEYITDDWLFERYFAKRAFAWGDNTYGQLGVGDRNHRSSPTQIGGAGWKTIALSNWLSAGVRADGTLWAWGYSGYGSGLNDTVTRSSPAQIGSSTDWADVKAGLYHIIALKTSGTMWSWGYNDNYYALGLTDRNHRSSPTQIGTSADWAQVSCGTFHAMAIKKDGSLWGWGSNDYGELGLGYTTSFGFGVVGLAQQLPYPYIYDYTWKQVACGSGFTIGIKRDGTIWGWGNSGSGQTGSYTYRSSPVQIGTSTDWRQVAAGSGQVLAIKTDGSLWVWGSAEWGARGDNVASGGQATPTRLGLLNDWKWVTCNGNSSFGFRADGTMWAWGYNGYGDLGLGDTNMRSSPVQVGTRSGWVLGDGSAATFLEV